ncbi:hypothetical protein [Streptomyces sp. NBC_01565]|uniref:hypothetical protein n=1 Tax=unclassified Streptomyces TaxID=2593676 RepID=UPI0022571B0B|nr:hypothetical protein [Streptomyces sp. NBC_01565]MCX4546334.1 hypothetical protein [Streptomyces sp. NBC_01565]
MTGTVLVLGVGGRIARWAARMLGHETAELTLPAREGTRLKHWRRKSRPSRLAQRWPMTRAAL